MEVTVAFYIGGGSLIDKGIQWWTADFKDKLNGKWKLVPSHVELSFDNICWWSASTRNGVYRRKCMTLNEKHWRQYKVEISIENKKAMIEMADSFLGMKYDWLNIVGSDVFKLNIGDRKRLTCDESAARLLKLCWLGDELHKINNLNPKRLEEYIQRELNGKNS